MRRSLLIAVALGCSLASLSLDPPTARCAPATTIPEVHFAIFRIANSTQTLVGYYEFSQPCRKALPDPGYQQTENLLHAFSWWGDFGESYVESRLTGELILNAGSVWMGIGTFIYPPSAMMSTTLQHGFTNPVPHAVIGADQIGYPTDANAAWALVQDTDVISRLAGHGAYEVYAWLHDYGDAIPLDEEIFIVAATRPVAPDDMAVLRIAWPRTLVTRGVPVAPEVVVHNFGDGPEELKLNVGVTSDPGHYNATQSIGILAADQSRTVVMPAITAYGSAARTLSSSFRTMAGGAWTDLYPSNDNAVQVIQVTDQPVFRHTLAFPQDGVPCDFDDDGDIDLVTRQTYLELWRNDGTGQFTDVTALSSLPARLHPRFVVCADFTGDAHPDLYVSYWQQQGLMLGGDGSGAFSDITTASGLGGVVTYHHLLVVDKENDGDSDLVLAVQGQETILENDGSGYFTDVTTSSGIVDTRHTQRIAAGDLNGDGYADLAFANWGQDATVFINDGDGTFTKLNRAWSLIYGRAVAIFDFDGDHDDDIFFLSNDAPSRLYRNDGGLSFTEVAGLPGNFTMDAGDFNRDGRVDVVLGNGRLFMNTGGAFAERSELLVEWAGGSTDMFFTDLNNDGDTDVYAEFWAYLNQGMPDATGVDGTPAVGALSALEPNFPNPFNPSTTLRYRVGTTGRVRLAIYNVAGQLVRVLVSQEHHPAVSSRTVVWDGRNSNDEPVASGVYLCRLVAPGFSQSRKLVLLK